MKTIGFALNVLSGQPGAFIVLLLLRLFFIWCRLISCVSSEVDVVYSVGDYVIDKVTSRVSTIQKIIRRNLRFKKEYMYVVFCSDDNSTNKRKENQLLPVPNSGPGFKIIIPPSSDMGDKPLITKKHSAVKPAGGFYKAAKSFQKRRIGKINRRCVSKDASAKVFTVGKSDNEDS